MSHEQEQTDNHQQLAEALGSLSDRLETHAGEAHSTLMTSEQIHKLIENAADKAETAEANTVLVLDALLGPIQPLSGTRDFTAGALHKIDAMWAQTVNGGIRSKLTGWDRIIIALIAAGATVLGAWIGAG